jgi:hypothetical protein
MYLYILQAIYFIHILQICPLFTLPVEQQKWAVTSLLDASWQASHHCLWKDCPSRYDCFN